MICIRKWILSLLFAAVIVFLYVLIFIFSGQDGDTSGSLSGKISRQCVEILDKLDEDSWSEALKQDIAGDLEHPIRKSAHFIEYALLAAAIGCLGILWVKIGQRKYMWFSIILWVFISALLDEWHQSFVPGRYCSFKDVLIDTCGGIFGLFVLYLICRYYECGKIKSITKEYNCKK